DHFTNELLKNNQDWKEYQELVISYQKNREELYGKSKRDNKDYAQNKIEDMKRRNGNAVLHVLAGLDKNANKYRKKLFADAYLKDTVPTENYIQSVLRELDRQVKYKQTHPKVAYIKKIKSSKKKKLKSLNLSQPLYTHASIGKLRKRLALQSKRELALAKSFTSKTKKEALREYEKMQAKEARSSENLGF
ncbi:relaxase MobL, partial [Lactobacillus mulieris]